MYADASIDPALAASIGRGESAVIEAPGGQRYRGTVQFVGAEVPGETVVTAGVVALKSFLRRGEDSEHDH